MPIPYFDFTKAPLVRMDTSPYKNLLSGALSGYQEGKQFKQQQDRGNLLNEDQAMKNEIMKLYGKDRERAELENLGASTAHEKRLASGMGGAQGGISNPILQALQAREIIEKKYGKNSPELSYIDSYLKKATSSSGNINSAATNPVKTKNQNAILANKQRLFLDEVVNHKYKGNLGSATLAKDFIKNLFFSDPQTEEDLINAGVASKVAPEFGSVQLAGQSVPATVHALDKQEKAIKQGWPYLLEFFVNNFPAELTKKIGERHSHVLGESARLREESFNDLLNNNMSEKGTPLRPIAELSMEELQEKRKGAK